MYRRLGAIGAVVAALWLASGVVGACGLDGIPSLQINGRLVAQNHTLPTSGHLDSWVPFVAPGTYHTGQLIHLREITGRVLWTLPPSAFKTPWRWAFGDGTQARGLSTHHVYRRRGGYVVRVWAYLRDGKYSQWFAFDAAVIHVS